MSSNLVSKGPCPACGSRDNLATYDDGHTHCFTPGCTQHTKGHMDEEAPAPKGNKKIRPMVPFGQYEDLLKRGISQATCEKFGYFVATDEEGKKLHVAPYRNEKGQIIGQKVRKAGKQFYTTGNFGDVRLFGQHLWKNAGKRIVIVEGEIDALSVFEAMPNWPVVSLPNGAQSAKKAIKNSLEFLESYERVVLLFDMDEPGQKAVEEVAEMFSPGKCAVAQIPLKDANEMIQERRVKELTTAIWEAQVRRPDGIVNGADLWAQVSKPVEFGLAYPVSMSTLNTMLYGSRDAEIVTWGAGSGIGKSALVAEITYDRITRHQMPTGYIALEENVARTGQRFVGMHLNKPIHLPGYAVLAEDLKAAFDATLGTGRLWTYDHFGSVESENLFNKMRYMVKGCGVRRLVLDHISIVVSGSDEDDERKALDRIMTRLRMFTEETGVGFDLVSHLKRPEGKGHEDGAQISLAHFRGSAAIAQLSDIVIGAERNQQAEDEDERNTTHLRVLKNRYAGITGPAGHLRYDKETGRLSEAEVADRFENEEAETDDSL